MYVSYLILSRLVLVVCFTALKSYKALKGFTWVTWHSKLVCLQLFHWVPQLIFIIPIWLGFACHAWRCSKYDASVAESRTEKPAAFVPVPI